MARNRARAIRHQGNWFTDAALVATGADVSFQNGGGMRGDLEEGPISIRDIFRINWPNDLHTFPLTGTELLEVLEFDNRDGKPQPMQISGITYTTDPSRPEGSRIVKSNVDPDRPYTAVSQAYLCDRAARFFGREIDVTNTNIQTVQGQIQQVRKGPVEAPETSRIIMTGKVE